MHDHGNNSGEEAPNASPDRKPVNLSWLAPIGLIALSFWNFFATALTLGIYHFWAKTEVRRRLWSGVRLNGEPLVYTGRGIELFLGFLIVFFVILLPALLILGSAALYLGPDSPATRTLQIVVYAVFFFLFGMAVYRAQRYRLARTNWRGIRGSVVGSPFRYAWMYFWTGLLVPISFGWILPWRMTRLQERLTNETRFGDRAFKFVGSSEPLYSKFAVLWIGTLIFFVGPTIGALAVAVQSGTTFQDLDNTGTTDPMAAIFFVGALYAGLLVGFFFYGIFSAWYRARVINYFATCTSLEGLTFSGTVQARGLIYVAVTNFLIRLLGSLIFLVIGACIALWVYGIMAAMQPVGTDPTEWETLVNGATSAAGVGALFLALAGFSLFSPITTARRMGYIIERLNLSGEIDLASIAQGAKQNISRGEGLAEAFDIDAI